MKKQIAIVGLGLIGGSLSMALRGFEDYEIVGVDRNEATLDFARAHTAADTVERCVDGRRGRSLPSPPGHRGFSLRPPGPLQSRGPGHRRVRHQDGHSGGRPGPPPGGGLHRLPPHGREGDLRHLPRRPVPLPGGPLHPHPPGEQRPGASGPDGAHGRPSGLPGRGEDHPGAATTPSSPTPVRSCTSWPWRCATTQTSPVPGLRGGLLPGLHPGGRPGRTPVDGALLHERPPPSPGSSAPWRTICGPTGRYWRPGTPPPWPKSWSTLPPGSGG